MLFQPWVNKSWIFPLSLKSDDDRYSCIRGFFVFTFFIKQLKQIQNSSTRFRSLSGDMMTGFVQAAVVGAGVEGAQRSVL